MTAAPPLGANPALGSFAGYVANPSKVVTKASATVTVPALNCKHVESPEGVVVTVTLQGFGVVGAVLELSCAGKSAKYSASWFEAGGGSHFGTGGRWTITIAAGDTVTESVGSTQSGSSVSVDDVTSKMSGTTKGNRLPGVDAGSSTVGMVCPGLACSAIPRFGSVSFTSATVNGKPLASAIPDQFQLKQITTSALGSDGESFTETYS